MGKGVHVTLYSRAVAVAISFFMERSWEILKLWHNDGQNGDKYIYIEGGIFLGRLAYLCKAFRDLLW